MNPKYFRDDAFGLVMETNGEESIYNPRTGEFQPLRQNQFIIDASPISSEEAARLRENYDYYYRGIPRSIPTKSYISSAAQKRILEPRYPSGHPKI
jgi:hypothetical protein